MPASMRFSNISLDQHDGPMVQTIFVFLSSAAGCKTLSSVMPLLRKVLTSPIFVSSYDYGFGSVLSLSIKNHYYCQLTFTLYTDLDAQNHTQPRLPSLLHALHSPKAPNRKHHPTNYRPRPWNSSRTHPQTCSPPA